MYFLDSSELRVWQKKLEIEWGNWTRKVSSLKGREAAKKKFFFSGPAISMETIPRSMFPKEKTISGINWFYQDPKGGIMYVIIAIFFL